MFLLLVTIVMICGITQTASATINGTYNECSPSDEVCEYWFTLSGKVTMLYKHLFVFAENGKLYARLPNNTVEVPVDKVISVDGFYRMVLTVNGTVPGPHIIAYQGQTLRIHFTNKLLSDTVTIHWHGLHQRGTPWMDGTGWINQCPIGSGQTFTYEFKVPMTGTYWYHSHVGAQRTNGVFGGLIVKERPQEGVTTPTEFIMTVGDWDHELGEQVFTKFSQGYFTETGHPIWGWPWVGGLIEGKGRYVDQVSGEQSMKAPLSWFTVRSGNQYRFRVICSGSTYSLRISVDNHVFTLIASDGFDVEPIQAESFVISPGERFDFLLTADQPTGNYWIRANSISIDTATLKQIENYYVQAVLNYEGASTTKEPTTTRATCTADKPCTVVNCPYKVYPTEEHINSIIMSEVKYLNASNDPVPVFEEDSQEYFLNFAFPGTSPSAPGSTNGRVFMYPGVNALSQTHQLSIYDCNDDECGEDKVCNCFYNLELPYDKTIQLVFTNLGKGALMSHPMHLHGHSFYVLKMGYSNTTANPDISCGNSSLNYCNNPQWTDPSWSNGNIPGLNLVNPPRKDTLLIPIGAYAVLRIRSDNPGRWFLHCHVEAHVLEGMAIVISEAMNQLPSFPQGLPICSDFYNDPEEDFVITNTPPEVTSYQQKLVIVASTLGVVCFLQFLFLLPLCIKFWIPNRKKDAPTESTSLLVRNINA